MRMILAAAVLIGVASTARSDEKEAEKLIEETMQAFDKLVDALKTIKDKSTAVTALPKLKEFDQFVLDKKAALAKLPPSKLSEESAKSLAAKFEKRMEKLEVNFRLEYTRVEAIPEAYNVIKDIEMMKLAEEGCVARAKSGVATLTLAMWSFKLKYGEVPNKLEELFKPPDGGKPFVKKDDLVDPWGRPYEYDPKGPKHKGSKADIWSVGPRHKEGVIIGNWMVD